MTKYEFVYSDIETYSPNKSPKFWYGGFKTSGKDDFRWYDSFKDYWKDLIEPVKGKTKVVVFHNSKYDLSILQYHAVRELGYTLNPYERGQTKAIYTAQTTEIYSTSNLKCTFVVDSRPLMPGRLGAWGDMLGFPKGDTPIVEEWREPTESDIEYLKRDIEILERAFRDLCEGETHVVNGELTQSSVTQAEFKKTWASIDDKRSFKRNGLKRQFSGNGKTMELLPLPKAVKLEVERTLAQVEGEEAEHEYGLAPHVMTALRSKLRAYYSILYTKKYGGKAFRAMQKKAAKVLKSGEYPEEFMELEIPHNAKVKYPNLKKVVDEGHQDLILSAMNDQIRGAMKGGVSYVNPLYKGKRIGAGAVLDINSMYPALLLAYELPIHYVGSTDGIDPNRSKYFVAEIKTLKATVKEGKHPFIKGNTKFTPDKTYLREIDWRGEKKGSTYTRALTAIELEYLEEVYTVEKLEVGRVFYYKSDPTFTKAIRQHIAYWQSVKMKAEKGSPMYLKAKLMLNTLWGRWAMYEKKVDSGGQKVDVGQKNTNMISGIYMTAYARIILNRAMNYFGSSFVYCDTDSVHFRLSEGTSIEEIKKSLSKHLDPVEFGKWDLEATYEDAKYIKPKTYVHIIDDQIKPTIAGLTVKEDMFNSLDDFRTGREIKTTKSYVLEDGRTVIQDTTYKI